MSQRGFTDAEIVVGIIKDMTDYGYYAQTYFEDWQKDFAHRLAEAEIPYAFEAIPPRELTNMAHLCGVRRAHSALVQAWLDAIDFTSTMRA